MILHLLPKAQWDALAPDASYAPESLAKEGFIHCSPDVRQLLAVANAFYRNVSGDVIVLEIDPAKLTSPLKWEAPAPPNSVPVEPASPESVVSLKPTDALPEPPPEVRAEYGDTPAAAAVPHDAVPPAAPLPDAQLFPHIYGPLNRDAVTDIKLLTRDASGAYTGIAEPPAPVTESKSASDPLNPLNLKRPSQMADELLDATDGFSDALKRYKDQVESRMSQLDDEIKKKLG
jgi:uncharacterized protein (DUF952 family)